MRIRTTSTAKYDCYTVADQIAQRVSGKHFDELPADVQEQMREEWRAEVQRQIDRETLRLETRIATVLSCIGLFLFVTVVWDVPTPGVVLAAVGVGMVTGLLWNALDVGRFGALLCVIPGYVLLRAIGPGQNVFSMFFGVVAMAAFATLLGAMREIRGGNARPSGLATYLRRLLRPDVDPSSVLADRGALGALSPGEKPCVRPWGPAPQQGGDEHSPPAWTEWDLDASDEEP